MTALILMVFVFQIFTGIIYDDRNKGQNELGICATTEMKLYSEGSVILSVKNPEPQVFLYKNGFCIGDFSSGKIGTYVCDGDVLELVCFNIKNSIIVHVDSVSKNVSYPKKGHNTVIFDKKITQIGVFKLNN